MDYSVVSLLKRGEYKCACGKTHKAGLKEACVEKNAIEKLGHYVKKYNGTKAYIIADENTCAAAGEKVFAALEKDGIAYSKFIFSGSERIEPDEKHVGSAFLHFEHTCDIIIGIGSGVINDIGKIVAAMTKLPYIIVGTAPSMDGFASPTSSVIRDSLKVSVNSVCPDVVIGDTEVLRNAPLIMIRSGLGDMLAKYISVCEWRIGRIVTGEYYCEEVAAIIRAALKKCVDGAAGIVNRDEESVKSVMEGLIISGIAADYAGISRPVSGVEHYFSHIWDMRALEFGTPWSLHGIQCGIGTLYALKGYEKLKTLIPDREKALKFVKEHDDEAWFGKIKEYIGSASSAMARDALTSERYDREKHAVRLDNIIVHWDEIIKVTDEELPSAKSMKELLESIGAPCTASDIGIPENETALTFRVTRDIRDKYILSSLAWDMGESETIENVFSV